MLVMEVSYCGKEFIQVVEEVEKDFCDFFNVFFNYKVLFCYGGGCGQFVVVLLNIFGDKIIVDYVDVGYWVVSVIKEVKKYCMFNVFDVKVIVDGLCVVKLMCEW